uniref:Uncharacterized protein n=1 Tax=Arundo donax TaxID=35708 RepID=A0A0A8ZT40_ARUDO
MIAITRPAASSSASQNLVWTLSIALHFSALSIVTLRSTFDMSTSIDLSRTGVARNKKLVGSSFQSGRTLQLQTTFAAALFLVTISNLAALVEVS